MLFGEDKMKIRNIVRGSLKEFEDMYSSIISQFVEVLPDSHMIKVSMSLITIPSY